MEYTKKQIIDFLHKIEKLHWNQSNFYFDDDAVISLDKKDSEKQVYENKEAYEEKLLIPLYNFLKKECNVPLREVWEINQYLKTNLILKSLKEINPHINLIDYDEDEIIEEIKRVDLINIAYNTYCKQPKDKELAILIQNEIDEITENVIQTTYNKKQL